jgi:hypothetical protein
MNLCNDNHDEICHEGRYCPVCEVIKEKDNKISELTDARDSLQRQIDDMPST